jgi:hypothetical protein
LEAEALLLIGVWTREIIFRRLGMAAALVTAAEMICFDAARIAGARFDGADTRADYRVALVFAVASAVFYFTSYWVARRWNKLFDSRFDSSLLSRFSYVGALTSALATWIAFPQSWTVVAWCILVFGLNCFAKRSHRPELRYQAHFLVAISLLRIASVNLGDTSLVGHFSSRAWTMTLAALLLYATRVWPASSHDLQYRPDWDTISSHGYTWSASLVVFLLAWYELRPVSVAVAWAVLGVVLFEVGLARNSISVRLQGYIALLASFCRIFVVNLGAQGNPGELSPRIYTVVPIMLTFFYVYERLRSVPEELGAIDRRWKAADLCAYLGTISVAALMRFEVPTDWVVAAWAALATVLTMVASRTRQNIFLHQSLLVTFAVLFRTILHNFYQRTYFPAPVWDSRALCVGTTVALLVVALPFTFRLRGVEQSEGRSAPAKLLQALIRRPEQVFFFVAVSLLTVLLALDMRHGMVTVSWGMEGLAVFLLALKLRERSFRLTGLGLLLLCVGKIVVVDAWRLTLRDRYLTLIILGGVLLLVSFLYTRHREAVRQYL